MPLPPLHRAYSFNETESLIAEHADAVGGVVIVTDVSGSMKEYEKELRVALSAAKCMLSNAAHTILHLPEPRGGTHLISCVERIVGDLPPSTKVLVLTDGDDTEWGRTSIPVGVDEQGEIVHRSVSTRDERRDAVVDYLANVADCDVHFVGCGEEVKDLVSKIAKHSRLVAGHISRDTNPREVLSVLTAVLSAPPSVDEVITVQSPLIVLPTLEEEERVVRWSKSVVVSSDPPITAEALDAHVSDCERALSLPECKYTRGVVAWFLRELATRGGPLPGALIGGTRTRVYPGPPQPRRKWSNDVNALLTQLKTRDVLVSHGKVKEAHVDVEGRSLKYKQVVVYSLHKRVPLIATEAFLDMYADAASSNKRKRGGEGAEV